MTATNIIALHSERATKYYQGFAGGSYLWTDDLKEARVYGNYLAAAKMADALFELEVDDGLHISIEPRKRLKRISKSRQPRVTHTSGYLHIPPVHERLPGAL